VGVVLFVRMGGRRKLAGWSWLGESGPVGIRIRVFCGAGFFVAEVRGMISGERVVVLLLDVPKYFRAVWRRLVDYPCFWMCRGWMPSDFRPRYWRGAKLYGDWRSKLKSYREIF
jgi:hypothetical protein